MLFASKDDLLRFYSHVLPVMALILTAFVVTQCFLHDTNCIPSPPPPPNDLWFQLVSYFSGIVHYFVGKDNAPAELAEVQDVWCDGDQNYTKCAMLLIMLVINQLALAFITAASSKAERVALTIFVNSLFVPCSMKLAGESKSDVHFVNELVCCAVRWTMDIWPCFYLEHMLYTSLHFLRRDSFDLGLRLVALWYRVRYRLLASWLVAFLAQFVDSLLTADVSDYSFFEMMLLNLREKSWTPMMYLGLCSAIGYLTDFVWKAAYLLVTRKAPRHNVTDNGLSEVITLVHARVICWLLGVPTADIFSFAIPFLTGLMAVRWIFRAIKPLLLSDDSATRIAACVVYVAAITAVPSFVFFKLYGYKTDYMYFSGNMFIALRLSTRGASAVAQSIVRRWYATTGRDIEDADFVVRVSVPIVLLLETFIVVSIFAVRTQCVRAAIAIETWLSVFLCVTLVYCTQAIESIIM